MGKEERWIWYPGDFEIHQGLLQNMAREERGFDWPAYWNIDDCSRNVHFRRKYDLKEKTSFRVHGIGQGYVAVNDRKYPLDRDIFCTPGETVIDIFIGNITGLPCAFVEGGTIYSDDSWTVNAMYGDMVPVGTCDLYDDIRQDPNVVYFQKETIRPASVAEKNGGVLFNFDKEVSGTVSFDVGKCKKEIFPVKLCFGESETEALDVARCYYYQDNVFADTPIRKRAFRCIFIPSCRKDDIALNAIHEFLHKPVVASFSSSDEELDQIWKTAEETFLTCCGILIPEGAKRDRWLWSGDAYQSYFVNQYLQSDSALNQRMIVAMRGNDPIKQHINTIVDYSLLWVISIENQYMMDGDLKFLRFIFPKMKSMMDYCLDQTDEHGFIVERPGDWIFVDWADMDKKGPVCAEQMFLWKALMSVGRCGEALGEEVGIYREKAGKLQKNINRLYWDSAQHAYIDSFTSGRSHVTRHANILAILFDIANEKQTEEIGRYVLNNDRIPAITTPYFKYFELDALGKLGNVWKINEVLHDYWGGMLRRGAVTFWEEFDPEKTGADQYEMYGDPYGKSLCHAWGASPVYLIGRYLCGVYPTEPGYRKYIVEPKGVEVLDAFEATVPVGNSSLWMKWENDRLTLKADAPGGTVIWKNEETALPEGKEVVLTA